jgi:hypothetical protein
MNKILTVNEVCPACGENVRFDGGFYFCSNGSCISLTSNDGKPTLTGFFDMVQNELAKREYDGEICLKHN